MNQYKIDPTNPEHKMGMLIAELDALQVTPPDLQELNKVDALGAVQAVYADNLGWLTVAANCIIDGEDASDAMTKAAAWPHEADALLQKVREQLTIRKADAINAGAAEIIRTLRARVFEPNLQRLIELSNVITSKDTLQAAISRGEYELAGHIKTAVEAATALAHVDRVRKLLHPGAFAWTSAFTTGPDGLEAVQGSTEPKGFGWWLSLIEAGVTLHFPTLAESLALNDSQAFKEYAQEQQEAKEAEDPWAGMATGSRSFTGGTKGADA